VNSSNSPSPKPPLFPSEAKNGAAKPDHIYMDAMAFGMGCCCLQITFQAWNVNEARRVYDALVPVTPIMLALTAASPAFRGYLADVDARWDVIAASVDDRTEEERGLKVCCAGGFGMFPPLPLRGPLLIDLSVRMTAPEE